MNNLKCIITILFVSLAYSFAAQALELQRQMEFVPGDELTIDIKAGNVMITGNDSTNLSLNTSGDVLPEVERNGNKIRVYTEKDQNWSRKNLDITINLPVSAVIEIASGAGDLAVSNVSGEILADLGAGDIYLKNVDGKIDAETGAGNIQARWQEGTKIPGQCRLTTGVGNITLDMPDSANAQIEAQTGLGKVSGKGQRSYGRRADLLLGSGQNIFKASTGIGNIDIGSDKIARLDWPENDILNWKHRRRGHHKEFHFELGGGPAAFWPDRSAGRLQTHLSPAGFPELRKESYCWGGEGYMQFQSFRLGFAGWGQTLEASSSVSDTQRYIDYTYDLNGLTMEYVPFRGRRADISLGALLGWADAEINLSKSTGSDQAWDNIVLLDDYRELSMKSEGFVGMPMVRAKMRLFGIVWLQAQAGYVYNRMGEWKTHTEKEIFNAPKADHSGWIFSVGPHFGI